MEHSFDIELASELGINCAIIYKNIEFWTAKNKANNHNFFDDKYWTYNSVKAWKELLPYLGEKAILSALKKLEENGYLAVGNYNKSSYDRTKWFSPLRQIHLPKRTNGFTQKDKPIPDNKPDNKPNKPFTPSFSENNPMGGYTT